MTSASNETMTWPEMKWLDIDADLSRLMQDAAKQETQCPKQLDQLENTLNEEKHEELAREIFFVHATLKESIHQMECEATLVRVVQAFFLQQDSSTNVTERDEALAWLNERATDWSYPRQDQNDSGLLQCIKDDILSSTTKEEFLQHLEAVAHSSIIFPVDNKTFHSNEDSTHLLGHIPPISEPEAFQDAKDIKRDQLTINGLLYPGQIGYDKLVCSLSDEISRIATQFRWSYNTKRDAYDELAKRIIHVSSFHPSPSYLSTKTINRTESGGSTYEILSTLIIPRQNSLVLLRPSSKDASPLRISIDMGAYEENEWSGWCFGIRILLETKTSYIICNIDDPSDEWHTIHGTYRNRIACSFGMSPFTLNTSGVRMDCGHVQFLLN